LGVDGRKPEPEPIHLQAMRLGRRIAIAIAGGVVVAIGVVLAVPLVPGPGIVVIAIGLAILSLEFRRPRIWLAKLRLMGRRLRKRYRQWRQSAGNAGP
jgi:hypothetical protein